LQALEGFLKKKNFRTKDIQRIRRRIFKDFSFSLSHDLGDESGVFGSSFKDAFLTLSKRMDSRIDGASKLLLKTNEGYEIETVILRIKSGRVTLCVSSQVGCTEKCGFCATAQMGFLRNLKSDEILDQIRIAGIMLAEENLKIKNIVFMGMGEPLRNYHNLKGALTKLIMGKMFGIAEENITVSTSGVLSELLRLAESFPSLCIALSLNASRNEQRRLIMPLNDKFPLEEIRDNLKSIEFVHKGVCLIEYILFENFNDTESDVKRLVLLLKGLSVHINLISYNSSSLENFNLKGSSDDKIRKFQKSLQFHGFTVTRRYSLGQDIYAACGQLANKSRSE